MAHLALVVTTLTDKERYVKLKAKVEGLKPVATKEEIEFVRQYEGKPSLYAKDAINPQHYAKGKFECIEIIEDLEFGYHDGNAMKYLWRYRDKGDPVENLRKCKWYIDRLISQLELK